MARAATVYLVDDQALARAAFRACIEQASSFIVVGDHGDPRAALHDISRLRPDVVLLDIEMEGLTGIDALPLILHGHPEALVVMLTNHVGHEMVRQAFGAGARGFVCKDADPDELLHAIAAVLEGGTFISSKVGNDG